MRGLIIASFVLCTLSAANAQMLPNGSIGNDPSKERLCAERAKKSLSGPLVPFEIDARYLASSRRQNSDVTFIAIDPKIGVPQLVECYLRSGTGRYEPASSSPEQWYWRTIKRKGSGIDNVNARSRATKTCIDAAVSKSSKNGFHHSILSNMFEIDKKRAGIPIGGKPAERYDISVEGTLFYRTSGPDLAPVKFHCLLSRGLTLKAINFE
jgi:hypothetical protein